MIHIIVFKLIDDMLPIHSLLTEPFESSCKKKNFDGPTSAVLSLLVTGGQLHLFATQLVFQVNSEPVSQSPYGKKER